MKAQAVHSEVEQVIAGEFDLDPMYEGSTPICIPESSETLSTPQLVSPTATSWTAFSDQYFEGGFENPFLDLCGDEDSTESSQCQTEEEEEEAAGEEVVRGESVPVPILVQPTLKVGGNEEKGSSVESSSPNSLG